MVPKCHLGESRLLWESHLLLHRESWHGLFCARTCNQLLLPVAPEYHTRTVNGVKRFFFEVDEHQCWFNPNTIKSYKNYLQNTQHMVLRNRPTLSIDTERLACLNNPPWRAAPDLRLARGRSRVGAPGPAGAPLVFFLNPPFLPPSPPNPRKC